MAFPQHNSLKKLFFAQDSGGARGDVQGATSLAVLKPFFKGSNYSSDVRLIISAFDIASLLRRNMMPACVSDFYITCGQSLSISMLERFALEKHLGVLEPRTASR